jgi:hypothetical protein
MQPNACIEWSGCRHAGYHWWGGVSGDPRSSQHRDARQVKHVLAAASSGRTPAPIRETAVGTERERRRRTRSETITGRRGSCHQQQPAGASQPHRPIKFEGLSKYEVYIMYMLQFY